MARTGAWGVRPHTSINAVQEITKALHDGDDKTAIRIAHTLKGLAGNIGAMFVAQQAAQVEAILQNTDHRMGAWGVPTSRLNMAIDSLNVALGNLLAKIPTLLADWNMDMAPQRGRGVSPHLQVLDLHTTVDLDNIKTALQKLTVLLTELDPDAEAMAVQLCTHLRKLGYTQVTDALLRQIAAFEYEGALQELAKITANLDLPD